MRFYWIKTNWIIKKIFSKVIWSLPNANNQIYLSFDDGPTPEVTQWVLDQLQEYQAKASFFCIGKNIEKEPELFQKIVQQGHTIGNHTFDHLNGWKTSTKDYLENIDKCQAMIEKTAAKKTPVSKFFRPPYGKLKNDQINELKKKGYKIIMWDVLSADFDTSISKEKCLENVVANIKPGSIIIFHDSIKALPNLKFALPKVLDFINQNNYRYQTLDYICP
ncbi:MAG: peptidoglycan-N-acetylglucosamine deacetylase [Bacteroidota bacterium]|nr:peptidoglycan-N-acetylglucosamine deacetylase [Bacteroidota bacterium]